MKNEEVVCTVSRTGNDSVSAACGGKKTEAPADTKTETETETPTTGDVKVAVVLKTLASEYWGYVETGCKAAR